jgi:hypothetical protein
MFDSTFWTKYFFRVCHIVTLVGLSSEIINEKLTGELAKNNKYVYMTMGIIVIVSGTYMTMKDL